MKWLYKYLAERQDVLRTHETHYKRWLARVNQHPADRETQELLAAVLSNLAVSRDECDRLMRFITHWSRHEHDNPEPGAQVAGWPSRVPPTASPPPEAVITETADPGALGGSFLIRNPEHRYLGPAGAKADLTSDTLFRDGVRVALEWVMRFRSDNVTNGEKDVQEAIAWAKSCNKTE